jgi:CRP/FNR family cyclic AMP-dependent transcriptional regulator
MPDVAPTDWDAKSVLDELGEGRSVQTYASNRIVFAQGQCADAVFYVQRGRVKASVLAPSGKEAVIAIVGSGEFLGEGCLSGQSVRMMTATTISPCSTVRIEKTAMIRLLHAHPTFAETFLAHVLARKIRIEEDLADQLFNSSEKRLARVLLLLANFGKEAAPEPVIAKLSQQTLADMIGTTRSRVSFFMNKFRRLGFIQYHGGARGDLQVNRSLLDVILHD